MNLVQRVRSVIIGILLIISAFCIAFFPDSGHIIAILILGTTLIVYGIRFLLYYFNLAKNMVDGRMFLYISIIMIDIGAMSFVFANVSKVFIVLYLFGSHAFSGGVDIMRALEFKKYKAAHWRFRLTYGIINVAVGFFCVIFIGHFEFSLYIYSLGLLFSAISRIISAFRKTSVVYIQ